jgi:hypothetical protein
VFIKSMRTHVKAIRVLVEAVRVLVKSVRVPVEALRLLQRRESVCRGPCDVNKSKRKQKRSDIEAKDRNETKTF